MDLQTYKQEANRTIKYLGDHRLDLAHMMMGFCSEHNELHDAITKFDVPNVGEEVADHCWYGANYATIQGIPIVENHGTAIYNYNDLVVAVSKLADLVKKYVVYNKPIDPIKEQQYLQRIFDVCYNFYDMGIRVDLPRALQNNIDKLRKRFPDKYSDELAQNRDLAAERAEIEK